MLDDESLFADNRFHQISNRNQSDQFTLVEHGRESTVTFYGSSFIADATGAIVAQAGRSEETVLYGEFDLDEIAALRRNWGVFRDRRPELYRGLANFDGRQPE